MASARASSCWLAGALPAAASAVAAAWSAMRRRTAVSVIPGRAAAACVALEVGHRPGQGGEHGALAGPGVHAHGHEQAQRLPPPGPRLDLDRAGRDGGEHGQGEHPGQVRWGLGGGGDRGHVLPQPAGQGFDRERGHPSPDPRAEWAVSSRVSPSRRWSRSARRPSGPARPGRRRSGRAGCPGRSPVGAGRPRRPGGRSGRRWPRWGRPRSGCAGTGRHPRQPTPGCQPAPRARSPGRSAVRGRSGGAWPARWPDGRAGRSRLPRGGRRPRPAAAPRRGPPRARPPRPPGCAVADHRGRAPGAGGAGSAR